MILEIHDHLGNPVRLPATRVLICLDNGTPAAFSVELTPEHIRHFRAGDPSFQEQLRMHGIDKTVLVTELDSRTLQRKKPGQ